MIQVFGILGFFLSLLAIYVASDLVRRTSDRLGKLEKNLFRANLRIEELENRVLEVDRIATEIHHQKKRRAQTITSMAEKGEEAPVPKRPRTQRYGDGNGRFTPSEFTRKDTG